MQQKLFDICRCKCHDFDICRCEKVDKVPKSERVFLNGQRSSRIMKIGSLDVKETRHLRKREQICIDLGNHRESRSRNCPDEVGKTFDLLSNENHQTPKPARCLNSQSEERNDSSTETECCDFQICCMSKPYSLSIGSSRM
ncbi:hypothetical protein AVEN_185024-1 [Araneus ventricosus]|uniref:Uncharacterized protein n=1 Tax=Araneus ventricosus TaxID=182803 RepID=A0A4Y2BS91_ARAVE|nr:hypothetical protein AVEN_185024-1 [Araneus ventricosus]